jgi:hypothetical protein
VDPLLGLGFTPEDFARERQAVLEAAVPGTPAEVGAVRELLGAELTFDVAAELLRARFAWDPPDSVPGRVFRLALEGDAPLVVESHADAPGMLPWKVSLGGESWMTWSPEVSRALASFVAHDVREHEHPLLQVRASGRSRTWVSPAVWPGDRLRRSLEARLRAASGAAPPTEPAPWERECGAYVTGLQQAFRTTGPPLPAGVVDQACWEFPRTPGVSLAASREGLLRSVAEAEEALAAHGWLRTWKAAGPTRELVLTPADVPSPNDLARARAAWADAGLGGTPELRLVLQEAATMRAIVYLHPGEPRALIIDASRADGAPHWLDSLGFVFHPRGGRLYVLVHPDGRREERVLGVPHTAGD